MTLGVEEREEEKFSLGISMLALRFSRGLGFGEKVENVISFLGVGFTWVGGTLGFLCIKRWASS